MTLVWIANYAGVIYATVLTIDESARGVANSYTVSTSEEFIRVLRASSLQIFDLSFTQNRGSWPFIALLVFGIVLSFQNRRARYVPLIIGIMLYGRELLYLLPLESLGLGKAKSYNVPLHRGAYAIALLFLLMQLSLLQLRHVHPKNIVGLQKYVINSVLICLSVAMLFWIKYYTMRDMLFEGGLDQLNEIVNLKQKDFEVQPLGKAFAVPYRFIPASLAGYGFIAMSDPAGGTFKAHRSSVLAENAFKFKQYDRKYYSDSTIDVDGYVSLSLLKRSGVKHIVSMIPLSGEGISLVSSPPDNILPPRQSPNRLVDYWWILRSNWLVNKELYNYHVSPKYAYVYGVEDANTFAYSPETILGSRFIDDERFLKQIENSDNLQSLYLRGSTLLGKKSCVVEKAVMKLVRNGYVIDVSVKSQGLLIVNVPFTKWWEATAMGQELLVGPGNYFQTVIDVPEGNYQIALKYVRPELASKILSAIRAWTN